ncbi:MAG: hypothetical protein HRT89_05000 [Lentisphaeria bacterium]|nr:hypothetical protein [Lentisphaeria bacterium]
MTDSKKDGFFSCGNIFKGCCIVYILLFIGTGIFFYIMLPKWLKSVDKGLMPWVESEARVIIGWFSLAPLIASIEESDITDKQDCLDWLDRKWAIASKSKKTGLDTSELSKLCRSTMATESGYYFALISIIKNRVENTTLTLNQKESAISYMELACEKLQTAVYNRDDFLEIKDDICSVVAGWRTKTTNKKGKMERDHRLRRICRHLKKLQKKTEGKKGIDPLDMNREFKAELMNLKKKVTAAEGMKKRIKQPQN